MRSLAVAALLLLSSCGSIPLHDSEGKQFDHVSASTGGPPTVILIHGLFMTPKCWDGWITRLGAAGFEVSAPAWPLHDGSIEALRDPRRFDEVAKLEFATVVDRFRQIAIQAKAFRRPVVAIGHSMGGLVAQILLAEGSVDAAVAVDSAPPHHVTSLSWSSLRANWGIISPLISRDNPAQLDRDGFAYGFANAETPAEQDRAYRDFYVPDSRRVGRAPLNSAGDVDAGAARGPLLLIAGGDDHIIPAGQTWKNFRFYSDTPGYSEFALFPGRDHWTIGAPGWESVADQAAAWIKQRFPTSR